jgi:hypothetical protein
MSVKLPQSETAKLIQRRLIESLPTGITTAELLMKENKIKTAPIWQ